LRADQAGHTAAFLTDGRRALLDFGSVGRLDAQQRSALQNVRLFADERDRRLVTGLTHQFLLAFLGAASGIVAALLLGTSGGPKITPDVSLNQVIGYNLLIVATILVLRVLFVIFRNR
jgi:hypothetical protein